jgi:hypothetical protein
MLIGANLLNTKSALSGSPKLNMKIGTEGLNNVESK